MKKQNILKSVLIVLMLIILITGSMGCARMAVNMAGGPMVSKVVKNVQNMESARLLKDGFAGDLVLITAITEMSPNNFNLLKECSFGYFAYGLMVEDEDPEYAEELFTIGKKYGLRALRKNKKFDKGLKQGKKIHELVGGLPKKYASVLCWTAMNDGFYLILNIDDPASLLSMADVVAMANKSIELDEHFFFGAASAFIAAYYALVPEVADPEAGPKNSAIQFDKARKISDGKLLLIDYLEARFLAISVDDEELFEKLLKHILSADSAALEGAQVFNEVAKIKAKYYLDHQDEFF